MTIEQGVKPGFFKTEIRDEILIIKLYPDMSFTSEEKIDTFWYHLLGLLKFSMIVISFENVEKLSSSVLGKIIRLNKETGKRGIQLALCSIKPCIFGVFQITNLENFFEIYETEDDAVKALLPKT